ncbi:MAG: hypothetical protein K8I82_31360 [Anaerolineae bacterium]|nr:hypothetical protein [Anaerolineae bacterium]
MEIPDDASASQTVITMSSGEKFTFPYTDDQHRALLARVRTVRVINQFVEEGDLLIRITDISTIERK